MVEMPFALTSERDLFEQYERERRLRLAQIAAPMLGAMGGAFFLIYGIVLLVPTTTPKPLALYLDWLIVGASVALLGLATYVANQKRVTLATNLIIGVIGVSIVAVALIWSFAQRIDPFSLALIGLFGLIIVFAGLLGTSVTIIGATSVTTLATLILLAFAPRAPDVAQELALWGALVIIGQVGFAGAVLAVRKNYQQTFQELSRLYIQVKQVDEIKDQFITSVNHELRNPIMAMHGYIEVLRLKHQDMNENRRATILNQAGQVGDRVIELLGSILDARRLDHGADDFTPQPVNVAATLDAAEQLINPLEGTLAERKVVRAVPRDLLVWGDPVRLQQVLTNLISNALKYSPPESSLEITARVVSEALSVQRPWLRHVHQERDLVEIVVRDHGEGIPPDQIPLLFRRFVRLPRDLASTTIGNGLGLYLCKIFIEAMRGRIWIESTGVPGEGTAFIMRLPLPPADYAPGLSPPADGDARAPERLVIGKDA